MESRVSDSNSIDISHALEHEQIEGLKRVLCDSLTMMMTIMMSLLLRRKSALNAQARQTF